MIETSIVTWGQKSCENDWVLDVLELRHFCVLILSQSAVLELHSGAENRSQCLSLVQEHNSLTSKGCDYGEVDFIFCDQLPRLDFDIMAMVLCAYVPKRQQMEYEEEKTPAV